MADKPLCPYCGEHNGHPDGVEMKFYRKYLKQTPKNDGFFGCPVCESRGPLAKSSQGARAAAFHRFEPLRKPLTLEEVIECSKRCRDPLWVEGERDRMIDRNDWADVTRDVGFATIRLWWFGNEIEDIGHVEDYGKTWRCWRTRPTAEERAAAKWEDGSDG